MTIDINPETERLVREEIRSGHFRSVDDLIISSIHAWREKHNSTAAPTASPSVDGNLHEFFMRSPLRGANLDLERAKDYPRTVEIE